MVGIIPMLAAAVVDEQMLDRAQTVGKQLRRASSTGEGLSDREQLAEAGLLRGEPGHRQLLLGVVGIDGSSGCSRSCSTRPSSSPPTACGPISAYHREHPYELDVEGMRATIDYEPAESTTDMFGGNSNWRGPVWFPLNYLVVSALERYHRFFGDDVHRRVPDRVRATGCRWTRVAADLQGRLVSIFLDGPDGRRPCFGGVERLQHDPGWKDNLLFTEYFHGDNGAGPRCRPPDGLDRARGRPHPAPARCGAVRRRPAAGDRGSTADAPA